MSINTVNCMISIAKPNRVVDKLHTRHSYLPRFTFPVIEPDVFTCRLDALCMAELI